MHLRSCFTEWLDRAAAFCGLLICLPVLAVAGAAILFEDGRPVLFSQSRVGRGHRVFRLWKLRSMRRRLEPGVQITASGDPRITKVGGFLRRYKLDEIPQLWNVCKGEMSLIGPRPEVPGYVEPGDPTWARVLSVRPGLTDLSSLVFRNEEELLAGSVNPDVYYRTVLLPEKLQLALQYQQVRSLLSDLRLLATTVRCSIRPSSLNAENVKDRFLK